MGMWSALAWRAAASGPVPTFEVPSESRTIAPGGRLPAFLGSVVSTCSGRGDRLADRGAAAARAQAGDRALGQRVVGRRRLEQDRPAGELDQADLDAVGHAGDELEPALWAAPRREGLTSVALIELEMSLASMIAALLTGTATVR